MSRYMLQVLMVFLMVVYSCGSRNEKVYLFSYFIGNGEDGLHMAYSADGLQWEAVNDGASLLTPMVGENKLMRDPCITTGPDGTFHMVWTTSWTGKTIGYASSKDLVSWSEQKAIPVMAHEDSVRNCWAPEINYNAADDNFLIYWSSTISGKFPETAHSTKNGYNHRIYYTTTRDFINFSETQLFYDPGFNVIDASIVEDKGRFVMFIKNETELPVAEKNISVVFADQIMGPYNIPEKPITGNYWAEGATAIKIEDKWHVYFDKYRDHQFGVITSDDLINWNDESARLKMPDGIRHGTVFEVSYEVFNNLLNMQ
jgi:sucrose-6-phosphate hydrolase SacC (GH32 family)